MKVEGDKALIRQLNKLPEASRKHVRRTIKRNLEQGERVAWTLAPDDTHQTRGDLHIDIDPDGMRGQVVAIRSDAPRADKDRTYSIEHGRKKGNRGTTAGYKFMWRTRQYLGKRFRNSIRRAIRKAAKEVTRG